MNIEHLFSARDREGIMEELQGMEGTIPTMVEFSG